MSIYNFKVIFELCIIIIKMSEKKTEKKRSQKSLNNFWLSTDKEKQELDI